MPEKLISPIESTTYSGATYHRLEACPDHVIWDYASPWHPNAFSVEVIAGAAARGPGTSRYMLLEDRSGVNAEGRWLRTYWVLA